MAFSITHITPTCLFLNGKSNLCNKEKGLPCKISKNTSCKDFQNIITLTEVRRKKALYIDQNVAPDKKEEVGKLLLKTISLKEALRCGREKILDEELNLED